MKWCAIGLILMAVILIAATKFQPQNERNVSSGQTASPASPSTLLGIPTTSRNRQVGDQKKISQQELAQQFIIEADKIIAEKRISFGLFFMYNMPDLVDPLAEQMDQLTVLQLLNHYGQWDTDVFVCGVCCHLLKRYAQLAPEEALELYDKKIGLSKVTEILKLSDEEEEEDLEKNPKAISTLSLMALASGYQPGKPGSRTLFQAFKKTIPWQEISRAMAEDEEELVGESGMLCLMQFCGMIAEECKIQPDFALAEWRSLTLGEPMKISILNNLTQDDEIPFRLLQNDVESVIRQGSSANDEKKELSLTFAKRIFADSPHDATQWLAQHKLPLEDRSASELDSLLVAWTPDTHADYLAWSNQLDVKLRSRIAAQKMEELCLSLTYSQSPKSELKSEYEMLDSLLPNLSSPERLLLIKNVAKRNFADDDKGFLELLHHLSVPETEVQSLLEEKNKSK